VAPPLGRTLKDGREAMPGKGEDRTEGLAEQSLNTSVVHPSQSSPDHQEHGDRTQSNRSITGNDQRKGLDGTDPDRPKPDDRYKP
jgi:hypothetical protein